MTFITFGEPPQTLSSYCLVVVGLLFFFFRDIFIIISLVIILLSILLSFPLLMLLFIITSAAVTNPTSCFTILLLNPYHFHNLLLQLLVYGGSRANLSLACFFRCCLHLFNWPICCPRVKEVGPLQQLT
ncbi:hypothetical protein, unlikely [Trypanosoma brucei gambiense DAL972]|uniref:Uncharacterized protein n=1 Tax=Trypanosoma brucei gambiense (strain MHOM/CI/86/DAL972) TaxID=679716 RepID=C9ZK36_TRYB9|nr:hypothetical protein, unlikely [Trypanosoma brucei gambiense DAL972]CBH09800.1 hypothetical protein, unlikely [Trypanosoma brucei gambiense DAL972]|eukprot:XP_011772093.1 hypothetical protein, unlikely [Trypanosoma brucei gambiense DAL972]